MTTIVDSLIKYVNDSLIEKENKNNLLSWQNRNNSCLVANINKGTEKGTVFGNICNKYAIFSECLPV